MPSVAKEEFDAQLTLLLQWSRSIALLDLTRLKDIVETVSEGPASVFVLKLIEAATSVKEVVEDSPDILLASPPRKKPQPEARGSKREEPPLFRKR